ncbi:TolC family protein [Desertivirga xinjiangensis]|uniref:TolC family protein n=1 Tax=Desertivirga xinjiangensis TaxID=539206 RepID=UPI00210EFF71|nr:TolC family protein [Pedobacter xinjiangensis]
MRNKTITWVMAAVLFFISTRSVAQNIMTLDQVLKEIESNNPSLKAFDNQIKSEDAKVAGAGGWMAPMIGAGTFMTPYPGEGPVSDMNKGAFMVSAEQDIPNPAKLKARKEYLKTQAETYFLGKTERFNELRAKARQLYFDLLIANKRIRFQKENEQIMLTMKKLAEIRYPYNQGGLNQIFKAEGRSYEVENMVLMTESEIRTKKIALNALMNRNPANELSVDTAYIVTFNPVPNLDTTYLAETRSDILHMQHNIHAMEANIKQMKQEAKPDFRLRFDHMSSYGAMMPKQFTVMGMLSIPIAPWSSKMYRSEINSMNYEKAAMHQQKEAMLSEMLGMAKSMENEINSMQKQVANYEKKIVPALNKNLKVSMLSYQENKLDLSAVIDAWEALNMTQMNYLDQLQKYYQMIAEYEKSIER